MPEDKRRPVLLLTRNEAIPVLRAIVAVPLTTRIRGARTEVGFDRDHGLPRECVASVDNIFTVETSFLTDRIANVGPVKMAEICTALRIAVDC